MNTKVQIWSVWCAPVATILYVVCFVFIAQYVPPTDPTLSAAEITSFYEQHRNAIRLGQLGGMVFSILFLPWYAVLAVQIARIEGRYPVLAIVQFAGGLILVVYFLFCGILWNVAAYRPNMSPELVLLVHDASWLTFVMVYPEYSLQMIAIAIAGLMDKRDVPLFPRWACYFNLWVAVSAVGGGFATFFKDGPFAYNGLFAFWIPVTFFFIWLAVMVPLMIKGIKRQAAEAPV